MRGFWRARQRSVGCISPHTWKLPLIMAFCILVYSLPLSLAVSMESPSGIRPTPDDSPNNQLVAPPGGNRSTFDVTYLGALTDKWLGWTPLRNKQSVCNKHSKQPPFGDIHVPLHGGKLLPPVVPVFKFIVLLLLLLLAGDIESNPGPGNKLTSDDLGCVLGEVLDVSAQWYNLGLQLNVRTGTLDKIRTQFSDPNDQLREMLKVWLKTSDNPTWKTLIDGLRSRIVGASQLAGDLETKYCPLDEMEVGGDTSVSTCNEPCITTYVRSLKSNYGQKIHITDDKRRRGSTSPRYINLTVVRKDDIDKSETGKSAKMRGNIDKKGSLELKHLDQREDGSKAKCVLVQGAPGIGKTTMAQELCRQWAEKELFEHYSLLVLLKLRNKSVQSAKEKEDLFLHSSDPSAVADIVEKYIEKETAFLLDGFDELPQEMQDNSVFVDLITKEIFPDACVIVTSRPSVSDILCKHCSQQNYQHVEVLGFTEEQRNSFVKTWFDENVEEGSRADERRQFESYLELHPHIRALMYIPLNCSIVIDVYQSSKAGVDSIVPTTQTELYRQNTLIILNRYRPKKRKPQNLKAIHPEDQEYLKKVSKLAYDGIVHLPQKLIFQEEEIPKAPNGKNGMGFMDADYDERSESYSYNFLHLTIQEFLAAYYISRLEASEQVRKINNSLHKRHLEIMLRFFAGLTKFQSSDGSRTPIEWLQMYYESGDTKPGSKLECLRWMFEAQDQELIRQVLGDGTQDLNLSHQTLAPFDCYILGYCIAKSDCQWKLVCRLGEEGMKMMVSGGGEGCLRNVQVINLNFSDLKTGVTHLVSALRGNTVLTELRLLGCDIDAEGTSDLVQALHVITTLRVLDLSQNTVGSQGVEHLASALRENTGLTELILGDCGIDPEGISQLAQALHVNTTLRVLELSYNIIDSECAEHLVSALRENTVLTELTLAGCDIDAEGISHLAQALRVNTTLKVLDLGENTVDSKGAAHLASALRENTVLTDLGLWGCGIDAEGISYLAQALCVNTTLRLLLLGENTVDSQGAEHLAFALRENTGLTELRLQCCHIDAEVISHLVQALCVNTTLRVLNLRSNTVDSQGAEHLASALRENKGLTELILHCCGIDAEGISQLVQALRVNTTMRVLDLSYNTIDSESAEHLALLLEGTCSLTELDLESCSIGEDGACQLARAIYANSTLKKLNLRFNPLGERGAQALVESLAHNSNIELVLPMKCMYTINKVHKQIAWD